MYYIQCQGPTPGNSETKVEAWDKDVRRLHAPSIIAVLIELTDERTLILAGSLTHESYMHEET